MIGPSNHTSKQPKHPSFGMATCCMELWDEYKLTIFNENFSIFPEQRAPSECPDRFDGFLFDIMGVQI